MDPYRLDWELGRLAALSRERRRRRLGVVVPAAVVVVLVIVVAVISTSDDSGDDDGVAGQLDLLVSLLLLVAVVVMLTQLPSIRRSLRSVPGILLGLDKPLRTQVVRDLKCGRPNTDPVLRAVEHIQAERFRRTRTFGYCFRAIYGAWLGYWLVRAVMDGSSWAAAPAIILALLVTQEVKAVPLYRNLSAFPWNEGPAR